MKAQVSAEFVIIFTLVLFSVMAFMFYINTQLREVNVQREQLSMQSLANSIKSEVVMASTVNENYYRRFSIPPNILGLPYEMYIEDNFLVIDLDEDSNYFTSLPVDVTGTFIEDINSDSVEHCITKDSEGEIRIARTQASVEFVEGDTAQGETFKVKVRFHCVESVRNVKFVLKYDPDVLELGGTFNQDKPRDGYSQNTYPVQPITGVPDALFKERRLSFYPFKTDASGEIKKFSTGEPQIEAGRYTFGLQGLPCAFGSGDVASFLFKVKDDVPAGIETTVIGFDPDFPEELEVVNCDLTSQDIPGSRQDLMVKIQP